MSNEEDREALADLIEGVGVYVQGSHGHDYINPNKAADAILEAGYRRTPAPSEDVRALIAIVRDPYVATDVLHRRLADALEAAVSTPQDIADEMVERAAPAPDVQALIESLRVMADLNDVPLTARHRDNLRRAADALEAAEKVIADALAVVRPGQSVPLGVSEARHWDRLLVEGHRILSTYEQKGTN